jgi:hypothetical protein
LLLTPWNHSFKQLNSLYRGLFADLPKIIELGGIFIRKDAVNVIKSACRRWNQKDTTRPLAIQLAMARTKCVRFVIVVAGDPETDHPYRLGVVNIPKDVLKVLGKNSMPHHHP